MVKIKVDPPYHDLTTIRRHTKLYCSLWAYVIFNQESKTNLRDWSFRTPCYIKGMDICHLYYIMLVCFLFIFWFNKRYPRLYLTPIIFSSIRWVHFWAKIKFQSLIKKYKGWSWIIYTNNFWFVYLFFNC